MNNISRYLRLDEPLSALDLEARPRTRSLLQQMLQAFDGIRLVITHDPLEALLLADRLVILEEGRILQSGPADEVRRRPRTPYVASLTGVSLLRGELRRKHGLPCLFAEDLELPLPETTMAEGDAVLATVAPNAVELSTEPPQLPQRGLLTGEIESIELAASHTLVRLATRPRLCAEVSSEAVSRQGLRPGLRVWASVDGRAVDIYPR